MADTIVTVDRIQVRRSSTPGYRPGQNGTRPLADGEEFINFADGVRLSQDGGTTVEHPLQPGIDDVPGLPSALDGKAGAGENTDITKLGGLTDLGAIPGLPLVLDSKSRTITDRLLDLARRSISAERFGAMGGQDDTAAWTSLVDEASSLKRPILASAYTAAFNGPAFIKSDDVRIFSEGGSTFLDKTGKSPCFVIGDPNNPSKRPSRINIGSLLGDMRFVYSGIRANKQNDPDNNPFTYGNAAHYHAAIYHACGDDFTVDGVVIENFDQPIHALGDAWSGSAYSKRGVIRRVRVNNAMFGVFASGWDGLVLEDIEGSLIGTTTSGSDGALFPPHVIYVGFTRGGDASEVPCLNVTARNLRCQGQTTGSAFKFRYVRGLIASGMISDGAPGVLELDLVRQFDVRGLIQRNTTDDAARSLDPSVLIRSSEDGIVFCGPIDAQAESTGPIHVSTYDVAGYRTQSRNVRIIAPQVSIGHANPSAGTRVPVLFQGTKDCSIEQPAFNFTTPVDQAAIYFQPGPNGETNDGVKVVLPRVTGPAGSGTKRLIASTDTALTGTLIAAASDLANGRSANTVLAGAGLKQIWLDDPKETVLASSAVAASTPAGTGSAVETVLASVIIPAGTLGANGYLEIETIWSHTNSANTKTVRVRFGGAAGVAYLNQGVTTTAATRDSRTIRNRGVASQIGGTSSATGGFGQSSVANVTSAINTAIDTSIAITGTVTAAGDVVTLESYTVRAFRQD